MFEEEERPVLTNWLGEGQSNDKVTHVPSISFLSDTHGRKFINLGRKTSELYNRLTILN